MNISIFKLALLIIPLLGNFSIVYSMNPVAYIGGKIGYGRTNSSVTTNATMVTLGHDDRSDLSGKGFDGGLLLGVAYFLGSEDCFFLGAELSASLSNISGSYSRALANIPNASEVCFKKKNDLDALFKVGFVIREGTIPFLMIGISMAQFELDSNFPWGKKTTKNHHIGLVLGLGVDVVVIPCLDIGIQGTHRRYNSRTYKYNLPQGERIIYGVKSTSNEFHVTTKWKFYQKSPRFLG